MRKLLTSICILMTAFMFLSCQTSPKATAPESIDLNGKWKRTVDWKTDYAASKVNHNCEIVQKGTEITIINTKTGVKDVGTLQGNVIHLEPKVTTDPVRQSKIHVPAREGRISPDGNTVTMEYNYTFKGPIMKGNGRAIVTYKREL